MMESHSEQVENIMVTENHRIIQEFLWLTQSLNCKRLDHLEAKMGRHLTEQGSLFLKSDK